MIVNDTGAIEINGRLRAGYSKDMSAMDFDPKRILDLGYCIQWAEGKLTSCEGSGLRQMHFPDLGSWYSVVDLMFAFGTYNGRRSARCTWANLKRTPPRSFLILRKNEQFWRSIQCPGGAVDYCSLEDFLDRVLLHLSGDLAEEMKIHRSRIATLVSTGSSLVATINANNQEETARRVKEEKTIINEVRRQTETLFLKSQVFSDAERPASTPLRAHNIEVIYVNLPAGPATYRRTSFAAALPDYVTASDEKLREGIHKMGLAGDLCARHKSYGIDGGFFDTLFLTPPYGDAQSVEASVNALTRPARTTYGREYYNTASYAQTHDIEPNQTEWQHMLTFVARKVTRVLTSTVRTTLCPRERNALLQEYSKAHTVTIPRPDVWRRASIFVIFSDAPAVLIPLAPPTKTKLDTPPTSNQASREKNRPYDLFETGKITFDQLKDLLEFVRIA